MFEVSFDRIRDLGGDSGFCLKTWERSFLLQVLTEQTHLHGLDIAREATETDIIIQQIKSL